MQGTGWVLEFLNKPFFGTGLFVGQFLAILLAGVALVLLLKKDVFGAIVLAVIAMILAGVHPAVALVFGVIGLWFFSTLFRLMTTTNVVILLLVTGAVAAIIPIFWYNAVTGSIDKVKKAMAEDGFVTMYQSSAPVQSDGGQQATISGGVMPQQVQTVKTLLPNAPQLWWDGLNRFPTDKPKGSFIPEGVDCKVWTEESPASTTVASEKWFFQCWQGSQDSPAWQSAKVVVNGYIPRAMGATIKKDTVSQATGYGEWSLECYTVSTVVAPNPEAAVVATSGQYRVKDADGAWLWTGSGYTSVGAIAYDTLVEVTGKTKSPKSYKGNPDRCILGGAYTGKSVHCGALEPVVP